jgi:spermidine/putrescine transport system permease protein
LHPFALWIVLLIILPHLGMFYISLREKVAPRVYEFGLRQLHQLLQRADLLEHADPHRIDVAAGHGVLALLLGFPIAYYIAKIAGNRTRGALFLMCLIPLWVSDLIRAFGWILLLRETGVISSSLQWAGLINTPIEFLYNDAAVIMGLVYTVILFMIVPLVSTLDGMDNSMIEAGYNLGGNGPPSCAGSSFPMPCPASSPAASWSSC